MPPAEVSAAVVGASGGGRHRTRHQGFTVIELLMVVTIIALLAGLIIGAISWLNLRAKVVRTSERMNAVLHALSSLGREDGSLALAVQRRADLGGVLLFQPGAGVAPPRPRLGAYGDLAERHRFGFPWSQENLTGSREPDVLPAPDQRFSAVALADLSTTRSHRLLVIAGVLPADDPATADDESLAAYRDDRDPRRPWNDAWGHPLVVAFGVFQPDRDEEVLLALRAYQYNRSVYLAVAAPGPVLLRPLDPGDFPATLAALWAQANAVCQPTPETTWTRTAFGRAPWQGLKIGRRTIDGRDCRALLSAPIEVK